MTSHQIDIFEALAEIRAETEGRIVLCKHVGGVRVATGGWTLEHDPTSPYNGMWVHGDPNCRRPAHPHEGNRQK